MIGAQEVAQWRPHAPWSTDHLVEQDFLLSQAVALVFEDKFPSEQVAMRGGTPCLLVARELIGFARAGASCQAR